MHLRSPAVLTLLGLLPLLGLLVWWGTLRARRRFHRFVAPEIAKRLSLGTSRSRRIAGALLQLGALGLGIVALARPQWGRRDEPVVRRGVDVVFALDLSASMLAEDVSPSRIDQARAAAVTLLGSLRGDRVGLVVFGGRAVTQCPLTIDYGAVRLFLDAADPDVTPGAGSDLGRAIEESARLFKASERRYKTIVLFTDGEDLEGRGEEAARKAKEEGIVVHAIGVGTPGGGPIPMRDDQGVLTGYKKDHEGRVVTTRFDSTSLEKIALGTDGMFLHAGPVGEEGARVAEAIGGMEKKEIQSRTATRFEDRFQIPLGAAIVLLCLDALWIGRRVRPEVRSAAPRPTTVRAAATAMIVGGTLAFFAGGAPPRAEDATSPAASPTAPTQAHPDQKPTKATPSTKPVEPTKPGGSTKPTEPPERAPSAQVARGNRSGNRLYEQQRYKDALARYEEASAAAPDLSSLRYNMGNALYRQKQYDAASAEYQRSLARAKGALSSAARYNLGNALYEQGHYQEAADAYAQVLQNDPADEAARRNLELALRRLKKPEQKQDQQQQNQDDKKPKNDQDKNQQDKSPQDNEAGQQQQQQQGDGTNEEKQPQNADGASGQDQNQQKEQEGKQPGKGQENPTLDKQAAERLLDSLAREERRDLKQRLARLPREEGKEKDW